MLTIYTDLNNTKWLEYLVEEFKRIQDANFDIRISSSPSNNSICINYCKQPISGKGSNIFNCNQIQPTFELTKMSDGSFIIPETKSNNEEFECKTDLFWNAFVFLSRLEEFNEEQKGNLIKSYSTKHPRIDKNSFIRWFVVCAALLVMQGSKGIRIKKGDVVPCINVLW